MVVKENRVQAGGARGGRWASRLAMDARAKDPDMESPQYQRGWRRRRRGVSQPASSGRATTYVYEKYLLPDCWGGVAGAAEGGAGSAGLDRKACPSRHESRESRLWRRPVGQSGWWRRPDADWKLAHICSKAAQVAGIMADAKRRDPWDRLSKR